MKGLVARLLELHRIGTLHIMDGGNVCVGCGGRWPCRTMRILMDYAFDNLKKDDQ